MASHLKQVLDAFTSVREITDEQLDRHRSHIIEAIRELNKPWSTFAVHQIERYRHGIDRALIDTTQAPHPNTCNLVVAELEQEFCPQVNLEWLHFADAKATAKLHADFPSKSRPINILQCSPSLEIDTTQKFTPIPTVVIFAENWRYPLKKTVEQLNGWDVFFFIDRFVHRTLTYSLPILHNCIAPDTFGTLRELFRAEPRRTAELLCSDWLGPHEKNHGTGSMPFLITDQNDFRPFKDNRSAAAFEEMRADVNAMIELHSASALDGYEQTVAEFICLERLFRYPVQHIIEKQTAQSSDAVNYDSIGSQLLARFLRSRGYLNYAGGSVSLADNLIEGMMEYAALAEQIQAEAAMIAQETDGTTVEKQTAGRMHITRFVHRSAGYDAATKDYHLDPMYYDLAAAIQNQQRSQ